MQTLQEVQKNFYSIGFSPKLKPFNHRILGILAVVCPPVIFEWIFLIHEADCAQEYMESIYIVTTCSGIFLSFMSTIFITHKLFPYIESIDEFSNERMENPTSKAIYEKTNKFVEKWSKIVMFAMKSLSSYFILPKAITSFFNYFTTDLGNDAFDLPIPMWFPYDWKNPIGYLLTVSIQFSWAYYPSQYVGCFALLAFGGFMFAIAFIEVLKNELHAINRMAYAEQSRKNMNKELSEFIRTHANKKRFFNPFSDLYEITLTIVFTGCVITICTAMLLIQIEISHNETDLIVLIETTVFGACALILLLFVCELGQRFSNVIDEINNTISQLDWYLFPIEVQRVLPTVMQNAQEPVVIKCFGNILCARIQFQKVVKTAYSYFMVLRKFYQ